MSDNEGANAGIGNGPVSAVMYVLGMVCAVILLAGCGPAGPRAVLKGERLIREQKYALAVQQLQEAIRLIPTNAQAWNHLGLALHYNNQPKEALKAYRQALALDRKLSVVHYNVGCLLLEQNDPAGAIDPLTSFTYLQPRSAAGWLKLGTAQLRARRFDAAETSFKRSLDLESGNVEAANNLGVAQAHRKRPFEALASFNQALRHDSRYGPAVLNASVVTYHQLNNPGMALQKLRQSMALKPNSQVAVLNSFANRLDLEINPPKPLAQAMAVAPAPPPAPTNPPPRVETAATTISNAPARTNAVVAVPPPPPRTNAIVAVAPPPKPVAPPPAPAVTNAPPATNRTETVSALVHNVPRKGADIEVTRLSDDIVVTPARDIDPSAGKTPTRPATEAPAPGPTPAEKRNLIARLNPFGGKTNRSEPRPTTTAKRDAPVAAPQASTPTFPRYAYLNPRPPVAGNRAEAARVLAEGLKAHQLGRASQAAGLYERAAQLDPAFFEAQHNLGLALFDSGNAKRALPAFENALALRPDSADARYNFALALKQANYISDAADQLERILRLNPEDTRAHLALGNLCAQKLNQPDRAREHYGRVLQQNPQHPQAAEIRMWLARAKG